MEGLKKPDNPNLSVNNIRSAAAKVGIATNIINDDVRYDHANNGILLSGRSGCLHFNMVTIKLIAPRIEDIPKSFNPNIHISAADTYPPMNIKEYNTIKENNERYFISIYSTIKVPCIPCNACPGTVHI